MVFYFFLIYQFFIFCPGACFSFFCCVCLVCFSRPVPVFSCLIFQIKTKTGGLDQKIVYMIKLYYTIKLKIVPNNYTKSQLDFVRSVFIICILYNIFSICYYIIQHYYTYFLIVCQIEVVTNNRFLEVGS